ncbi:hypothetical protein [Clostridium algidicarnis]|uniref:hypothetical protein n=1 Tax=Clostridium algidicarnis TaxID=37659 RepID=UPI001C0B8431|nr:hypothetical protein [Clostridium algidicarnis]MBU3193037.1 hypothetical protein [Clostridium algidicarnis]
MSLNKKQGSALLSVIMVFAILFTIGGAVMSLALSDFKLRINESKRVQNLYNSDSGLDEAYGIIETIVEDGITKGNSEVKIYLDTLNGSKVRKGLLDIERDKFNNKEDYDKSYINADGSINQKYIVEKQGETFKNNYKQYVGNKLVSYLDTEEGYILNKDKTSPKVKIITPRGEINFKTDKTLNKESLDLNLQSSFSTLIKEENETNESNVRKVAAKFKLWVPDYNNPYSVETTMVTVQKNNILEKAMVADKDIINAGKLDVEGSIYALANSDKGKGIELNGAGSSINILKGNLLSLGDIRIKAPSSSISAGEDSNIYTGSLAIDSDGNGSTIGAKGRVYANNDLSLGGTKSKINIEKGFYGVNDITKTTEDIKNQAKAEKNSSSILVNASDIGNGSEITIKNEAILMGTAYLKTNPYYQTGESVGIKGNYRAYASPLEKNGSLKKDNIVFEYQSPLQLATTFKNNSELNFNDKNNYFMAYIDEYKGKNMILNGISLPENTISVGAKISNGEAKKGNYTVDNNTRISEVKKEYESIAKEITKVSDYIDFSKVGEGKKNIIDANSGTEVFYVSSSVGPITISSSNIGANNIRLKDGKGRGIIIAKGDIELKGDINFQGLIITDGNITIKDSGNKHIVYDSKDVKYNVAKNYNYLKGILKNNDNNYTEKIEVDASYVIDENIKNNTRDSLITTSNWKIIK